jgi:ribosome recycling factor
MLEVVKAEAKNKMERTIENFEKELKSLRTGRASANFLDPVHVEAYGSFMPLNQVGAVTVADSKMLLVQIWDASLVKATEKAINNAGLGVSASSDGQTIRVPIPPLSEERRREMVKIAAKYAEQARVSIRNARRDILDEVKKSEKDSSLSKDDMHRIQDEIQKVTDQFIKKIDESLTAREKEIMQV